MQAIRSRGERLAFDLHVVGDAEHGVLIRSDAPRTLSARSIAETLGHAVGNQRSPDFSAPIFAGTRLMHLGAVVVDRDLDRAEILCDDSMLIAAIRGKSDRAL